MLHFAFELMINVLLIHAAGGVKASFTGTKGTIAFILMIMLRDELEHQTPPTTCSPLKL